jgi:hypothetical protein
MERGYGVIIAGAAIFVIGMVLTTVWALPLAQQLQADTTILNQLTIFPDDSTPIRFTVSDTEKPLSVVVTTDGQVSMRAVVTGPEGDTLLDSEFSETYANTAYPTVPGQHELVLYNEGTQDVTVDVLFGHIPGVGEGTFDAEAYGNLLAGMGIIIAGVAIMAGGVAVWAVDRRRKGKIQKGG